MKRLQRNPEYLVLILVVVVNTGFHLLADFRSGFHGDEFLHIEAGKHLAFGFMDFPPVIAVLAWIQNLFHSDSLFIHHLFVHIATVLILVYSGMAVMRLGGKSLAVLIALLAITFSPGLSGSQNLFLPVVFEQLAWVLCIYYLLLYCIEPENKYLIPVGIFAALGFLTKYNMAFFITGLFFSVMVFRRDLLKKKALWIGVLIFLLLISPNVIWQIRNGLPVIRHISELYKTQLDQTPVLQGYLSLIMLLNPFTAILWFTGLFVVPFISWFNKYRLLTFTLLFASVLLILMKGKDYYFFPIVLGGIPPAAVFLERLFQKRQWIVISYATLVSLSGAFLLPNMLPVLPLYTYVRLYHLKKNNDQRIPLFLENFYSTDIWNQLLALVDTTYNSLTPAERQHTLIWGRHYSEACGVNLLGRKYGLPPAFSFHSSCFTWVPDFSRDVTVIAISEANLGSDYWGRFFREVTKTGSVENPYASNPKWYSQQVFLCRGLRFNSAELKQLLQNEIF